MADIRRARAVVRALPAPCPLVEHLERTELLAESLAAKAPRACPPDPRPLSALRFCLSVARVGWANSVAEPLTGALHRSFHHTRYCAQPFSIVDPRPQLIPAHC